MQFSIPFHEQERSYDHLSSFLKDEMNEESLESAKEFLQQFMLHLLQKRGWEKNP